MKRIGTETAARAILYIETHLSERLDLETVAEAAHYSKYHLHRMFTEAAGITLHDYIRRRRLTAAAKLLVFSEMSVMDIALAAGYESRQAFTDMFKAMYKQTPGKYRAGKRFYPLQLELDLEFGPPAHGAVVPDISRASGEDVPAWLAFASQVVRDFPGYQEEEHLERLNDQIRKRQAFLMRDRGLVVGAAAFSRETGDVDFLGVLPRYRRRGVEKAFLDCLPRDREIHITTFRADDRADTGQRRDLLELGFSPAELLTEYGYPTQRLVLPAGRRDQREGEAT